MGCALFLDMEKKMQRIITVLAVSGLCACALLLLDSSAASAAAETEIPPISDVGPTPEQVQASNDAYVIQVKPGQTVDEVTRIAVEVLGQGTTLERLFPAADPQDDPGQLSLIYRAKTTTSTPDPDQWDKAYEIKARGDFENVEPDTDTAIEDAQKRQAATACLGNDGLAPPMNHEWSLVDMHVPQARTLPLPLGGQALGEGVRICHPDSGWSEHDDLDFAQIDTQASLNLMEGGVNARDPMNYSGNPGHGTATGSVIISSGRFDASGKVTAPGAVNGLAPKAKLVPIRALNRVVQVFDSDIARAVHHASTTAQCDVISMSLGGKGFFGLEKAIEDAVRRDVIVVSAAGNCAGFVVAPASYDNVIAVAATNFKRKPWNGTSQGRAIDIAAPGEDVYVARPMGGKTNVAAGSGTSFSTAAVAGAAADWLAFHGKARVKAAQGTRSRQELFMQALSTSADPGVEWKPKKMGPGILNLEKLLAQPLPNGAGLLTATPNFDVVTLLHKRLDLDRGYVESGLARLLGNDDVASKLDKLGPEIVDIASRDPDAFIKALAPAPPNAFVDHTAFLHSRGSSTLKTEVQP